MIIYRNWTAHWKWKWSWN